MEEEDKDAFQEEERAGESFLQPSSKSRCERSKAHLLLKTLSSHLTIMQVHPEEEKEKTGHGEQ